MAKRPTRLILGTGNPGDKYISCRSNIGFKILDVIANNNNISIRTKKKKSLIGMGSFEGKDIVFLKPQTFAELSGESALYIASFLRIDPREVIVILDDFTLPLGKIVAERGGDDSVHPVLPNLKQSLKANSFIRLRVGILGENPEDRDRDSYLKSHFDSSENIQIIKIINDVEAVVRSLLHGDVNEVVEKYKL